jgi:hypothetical protein
MAGFWIPWEVGLTRKQEVLRISKRLSVTRRDAAACCMEVWEWANNQSIDGLMPGLTPADVSEAVAIPGIGEAMAAVGWLVVSDGAVQFPHWDRYNGRSARERFLIASRVRHHRAQQATAKAHRRNG